MLHFVCKREKKPKHKLEKWISQRLISNKINMRRCIAFNKICYFQLNRQIITSYFNVRAAFCMRWQFSNVYILRTKLNKNTDFRIDLRPMIRYLLVQIRQNEILLDLKSNVPTCLQIGTVSLITMIIVITLLRQFECVQWKKMFKNRYIVVFFENPMLIEYSL